ncbi:ribosome rescue GTPase HflX [Natronospira bacteriovora]|uniref:GTPase HflX n=1 Tax=Natronospira bacteriovora TaxID=3069753 RepID=A0ABU0W8S6_9GAMM|nr:ribosome rescue GTPase HflX [Natronospira sp. AB-CW4]MDQ2069390.1 ribosome rescue GTPase HflX [Natronospira sp. AB-CW4]
MFDRPEIGSRALIVHVDLGPAADPNALSEFRELARSAGAEVLEVLSHKRSVPDPRYFVGGGKAEEIAESAEYHKADLVLVNHHLSPSQERNLEARLKCRVLDRTGLILDIFAQRAQTHEGKLQVELAQLTHLSTRLVRGWTHLERQKGGIGLRGPGETQLEMDRRLIGQRIKQVSRRLEKVRKQRDQGRQGRRRREVTTASLVGYTNAGKSTLFNRLTDSAVYQADQLFATLDPTLRHLPVPGGSETVIADTVGFIRDLPHDLVAAFRSTLQETRDADLLLHVVDAADPEKRERIETVNEVLAEIGAEKVPQLLVLNKIDLAGLEPGIERDEQGEVQAVRVSALTGEGMDLLLSATAERLAGREVIGWVSLAPEQGRLRARLFELDAVEEEGMDDQGRILLRVRLSEAVFQRLAREHGLPRPAMPEDARLVSGS